jgi:hypothetical protein
MGINIPELLPYMYISRLTLAVLFNDAVSCSDYMSVNNELERILKCIWFNLRDYPGTSLERPQETSIWTAGVPAKIQTSQKWYHLS